MSAFRAVGAVEDDHVLDQRQAGPTVSRMVVGSQLRRLREAAGISRADAGYAIRASDTKISRLELGRTGFKPRDVADLLTLYGVTAPSEREAVMSMAEQAGAPGWWQVFGDVMPSWFEAYVDLLRMGELPNITVQLMPFSSGGHPAGGGPITILRLAAHDLPDVVYLEQLVSALYPDKPGEITHYWDVMNRLSVGAEPPEVTVESLRRILKEL